MLLFTFPLLSPPSSSSTGEFLLVCCSLTFWVSLSHSSNCSSISPIVSSSVSSIVSSSVSPSKKEHQKGSACPSVSLWFNVVVVSLTPIRNNLWRKGHLEWTLQSGWVRKDPPTSPMSPTDAPSPCKHALFAAAGEINNRSKHSTQRACKYVHINATLTC